STVVLKIVATRLSAYYEWKGILPEAQWEFRTGRSTVDMMVVRRLQELAREKNLPLCMCFIDLQNACDSVDRSLLWKVQARYGIPAKVISIIRRFHDGMRACVRLDSGETSQWHHVNQGLRQGCVLSPDLFSIFSAAVLTVTFDRFSVNRAVVRDVIRIAGRGGKTKDEVSKVLCAIRRRRWHRFAVPGKPGEAHDGPRRSVCSIRSRPGQRNKQFESFLYLGGKISNIGHVTPETHSRIGQAWTCFYNHSKAVYENPCIALDTEVRLLKTEVIEGMLNGCVTWTIAHDDF
ncbi:unnamed protein product, partial [Sphacelaria rigidula]